MVMAQLGALIVGLCVAFTLRNVQLGRANRALHAGYEELEFAKGGAEAQLAELQDAAAAAAAATAALAAERDALSARVAELEAEQTTESESAADDIDADSPDAVKELMRNFAQDSREKGERIQELEKEIEALRAGTTSPAPAPAAPEAPEAPEAESTKTSAEPPEPETEPHASACSSEQTTEPVAET